MKKNKNAAGEYDYNKKNTATVKTETDQKIIELKKKKS